MATFPPSVGIAAHKRKMGYQFIADASAVPLFLACYFGQCSYLDMLLAFHIRPIGTTSNPLVKSPLIDSPSQWYSLSLPEGVRQPYLSLSFVSFLSSLDRIEPYDCLRISFRHSARCFSRGLLAPTSVSHF